MSEITATKRIQYSEYEKLFEYYALLCANVTEAKKANLMEALLTQANIAVMEQPLQAREVEEWRGRQAKYAPRHHVDAFVEFVEDREEWALKNIAYSTAPSSNNSANSNLRTSRSYERKEAKVMAVKASARGSHTSQPRRSGRSTTHGGGHALWMSAERSMHLHHVHYSRARHWMTDWQSSEEGSCVYSAFYTWTRRCVGPWARWTTAVSEGAQELTMCCYMTSSRTRK
jgi:hypothetical protein